MNVKLEIKKVILIRENDEAAILTTMENDNNNIYSLNGKLLIDYIELILDVKVDDKFTHFLNLNKTTFSKENLELISSYFKIENQNVVLNFPTFPCKFSCTDTSKKKHQFTISEQAIDVLLENFQRLEGYAYCVPPPDGCSPGPPGHGDIFNLPIGYGD